MRRIQFTALFVFVLSICTSSAGQTSKLAENHYVKSNIALLEAWLDAQMAYRGLPGMTIGIVYDQELIYAKGFGCADLSSKRPSTPDTIYRWKEKDIGH